MPGTDVISAIVALVVVVAVVVAVSNRSRDDDGGGVSEGSLRRLFVYALVLLGTALTTSGVAGLLRGLLEAVGTTVVDSQRGVALGLALTTVGAPVWWLSWRHAERAAASSEDERTATGRRVTLALIRLVALAVGVPYLISVGHWIVGADPYDPVALSRALVWLALWGVMERVASQVPFGSAATGWPDRLAVYLAATAGVVTAAVSTGTVLARSLEALYDGVVGSGELVASGSPREVLVRPAVAAVVGAALWWWHWWRVARADRGSTAWYVVVFLVGVLSGTLATLTGASVILHATLAWLFGAATGPASGHFDVLPAAVAALVVGGALWGYHRAVYQEHEQPGATWSGPERIHRYLVAGVAMLATAGGIATLLAVAIDASVAGQVVVDGNELADALAFGITLVLVGAPVWWYVWRTIEAQAAAEPRERTELPRRVLIFGVFGAAIITTVTAASVLLFTLFEALLEAELTTGLIEDQRWSIALLLTAGAVSLFHGLVLREDRRIAGARAAAHPLHRVFLVAADPSELSERLRERPGVERTLWTLADPPSTREEDAAIAVRGDATDGDIAQRIDAALDAVSSRRALVVVRGDEVLVLPLSDGTS